ncbi:Uu.00g111200.m01.CDS01 [Anthostomella pinea]|uniref:Uu.00g111200.m01.CDS01 n=1 Tax=Anthostomella pinea TaxID=933095 RepID=A0AAI8V9W6_9PEZI|nr:Uu.00g111200.m01.CDS01 [Anthostomella pinea]
MDFDYALDRELPMVIIIDYHGDFKYDRSESNKAIAAVYTTKPGQYLDWRGHIIAYGSKGLPSDMDPTKCTDVNMADFKYAADMFLSCNSG